jgi:ribosome-binding protein aMBF1 (putative translation factor)
MSEQKVTEHTYRPSVPWRKSFEKHLENPEVRAEYKALEEEYALIRQLIDLRIERGLSQRQLAKRAGMQQPVIARLEGGKTASLRTLKRVADALDADVRVTLIPRHAASARASKRHV